MKQCKICGKEIEGTLKRLYCSISCNQKAYYLRNSEKRKQSSANWRNKNLKVWREYNRKAVMKFRTNHRVRFNKLVMDSYHRHKDRWSSRNCVNYLLKLKKKSEIELKCKKCGSKDNISLKFEVYPTKSKDIRQAIKDKKIYYTCKGCRYGK